MRYLLLHITFFICIVACSQPITFQKFYGGTNVDNGRSVEQTNDGGYIIAGEMGGIVLIKTNAIGDTLWSKNFGGGYASSAQQTADGGYILLANFYPSSNKDISLIKTDPNGIIQWSKTYGGTKEDIGYSVQTTYDGGYIIAGYTQSFGSGQDIYLLKIATNGNILWSKTYGGTGYDEGRYARQTIDGGYIITGTDEFADAYLIKTDANGDTLWTKTFGGTGYEEGWDVQQTSDGGYIIGGITNSFGTPIGYNQAYLVKTNSAGILQWSKTFGNSSHDECYSVQQTQDGGYILVSRFVANNKDILLVKTDANGDTLWTKIYGFYDEDFGWMVRQTADKGYIITGQSRSFGPGGYDIYLIKTDSIGNSGCGETNFPINVSSPSATVTNRLIQVSSGGIASNYIFSVNKSGCETITQCEFIGVNEIEKTGIQIDIFPNPFLNSAALTLPDKFILPQKTELIIYDVLGKELRKQNITSHHTTITKDNLSVGVYFCKIISGNSVIATGKFIVQ